MQTFYSAKAKAFFDSEIHGDNMPPDAIPISTELHMELLNAQQTQGKMIASDEHGAPFLMDRPPLSVEDQIIEFNSGIINQIESIEREKQPRAMRDFLLNGDKTRLEELNTEIESLRAQLK